MPILDDDQITEHIAEAADKLEIALTAELETQLKILPPGSPRIEWINQLRKALMVVNGGGEGCKELVPHITQPSVVEMVGQLMCMAGMLGLDYVKIFSGELEQTQSPILEGLN